MIAVEGRDALDPALIDEIRALIAGVTARDAAPPLSDHAMLQLADARPRLTHLVARDGDTLAGYAQLDAGVAELAVRAGTDAILAELAVRAGTDAILAELERRVGAPMLVWSHGKRSPVAPAAKARGYAKVRALWRLRRTLTDLPTAPVPDGVTIRTFVPGRDEDAWLAVNAAAFAEHAEQGQWTRADLEAREAQPWFDPAGFLLAERGRDKDSTMLGFHWTKVHGGGVGEVYVLGVSPTAKGMHLGPALLAAGLGHLADHGQREVILYVDESNSGAMRLYERFGFERDDIDAQYRWAGP